jgi:hypothetical protein
VFARDRRSCWASRPSLPNIWLRNIWDTIYYLVQPSPVDGVITLATQSSHPALSKDLVKRLRDGIASSRTSRGLSPEARVVISDLCRVARSNSWTPEQLLVAVKDACYSSPEISSLTTTSERETVLARIVSGCINEFYNPRAD